MAGIGTAKIAGFSNTGIRDNTKIEAKMERIVFKKIKWLGTAH